MRNKQAEYGQQSACLCNLQSADIALSRTTESHRLRILRINKFKHDVVPASVLLVVRLLSILDIRLLPPEDFVYYVVVVFLAGMALIKLCIFYASDKI